MDSEFLAVMATTPAPVTVITCLADPEPGTPVGTTVSAFSSLSRRPPMVMIALDRDSRTLAVVSERGHFGVNLLSAGQAEVGLRFAGKEPDRFANTNWSLDHGLPRLSGTAAWVACSVAAIVPGGDHDIVLGAVEYAEATGRSPLIYSRRRFGTHRPHITTGLPGDGGVEGSELDLLNAHAMALMGMG